MHFCFIAIQSTLLTSARCSIIKSIARATKIPKVPLTYSSGMFPDIGFHDGVSVVNSLWPGDAIWRHGARSTLAQVMACYLTAPSHYLNQCWLIIDEAHSHSSQGIIIRQYEDTNQKKKKTRLKIAVIKWHLGLQGVNPSLPKFLSLPLSCNMQHRIMVNCDTSRF